MEIHPSYPIEWKEIKRAMIASQRERLFFLSNGFIPSSENEVFSSPNSIFENVTYHPLFDQVDRVFSGLVA